LHGKQQFGRSASPGRVPGALGLLILDERDQVTKGVRTGDRVRERLFGIEFVVVSRADAAAPHVAGRDQIGEEPIRGPPGDADVLGDLSDADLRIPGDCQEPVRGS